MSFCSGRAAFAVRAWEIEFVGRCEGIKVASRLPSQHKQDSSFGDGPEGTNRYLGVSSKRRYQLQVPLVTSRMTYMSPRPTADTVA